MFAALTMLFIAAIIGSLIYFFFGKTQVKYRSIPLVVSIVMCLLFVSTYPLYDGQASHTLKNVPKGDAFNTLLKRDLLASLKRNFMVADDDDFDVEYELLTKDPTQSKNTYPKYYVWTIVHWRGVVWEGAAHAVAIDQVRFDIMLWLGKEEIMVNQHLLDETFPQEAREKILEKLKVPLTKTEQGRVSLIVYRDKARKLSDSALVATLNDLGRQFSKNPVNYNADLAYRIKSYEAEYVRRHLSDPEIEKIRASISEKAGPCFGIPDGQCFE